MAEVEPRRDRITARLAVVRSMVGEQIYDADQDSLRAAYQEYRTLVESLPPTTGRP